MDICSIDKTSKLRAELRRRDEQVGWLHLKLVRARREIRVLSEVPSNEQYWIQKNIALELALPDPAKLELLADWIDAKYPNDDDTEVQEDLRCWAKDIWAVLEMK